MKRFVLLALIAVGLSSCAGQQPAQTALVTTGSSLIAAGDTFATVGAIYTVDCKPAPKPKFESFCSGFHNFIPKFQADYPTAVSAWTAARNANDNAAAVGAVATILQLITDLSAITVQAIAAAGG